MLGCSPNDADIPVSPFPYALVTYSLPVKSVSPTPSLDAEFTYKYSVANPVPLNFLAVSISPDSNPVTFSTDIVVCVGV